MSYFYQLLFVVFLATGSLASSCPGQTEPGCICDEYQCTEGYDQCCKVDGNYFCAADWQNCYGVYEELMNM